MPLRQWQEVQEVLRKVDGRFGGRVAFAVAGVCCRGRAAFAVTVVRHRGRMLPRRAAESFGAIACSSLLVFHGLEPFAQLA